MTEVCEDRFTYVRQNPAPQAGPHSIRRLVRVYCINYLLIYILLCMYFIQIVLDSGRYIHYIVPQRIIHSVQTRIRSRICLALSRWNQQALMQCPHISLRKDVVAQTTLVQL